MTFRQNGKLYRYADARCETAVEVNFPNELSRIRKGFIRDFEFNGWSVASVVMALIFPILFYVYSCFWGTNEVLKAASSVEVALCMMFVSLLGVCISNTVHCVREKTMYNYGASKLFSGVITGAVLSALLYIAGTFVSDIQSKAGIFSNIAADSKMKFYCLGAIAICALSEIVITKVSAAFKATSNAVGFTVYVLMTSASFLVFDGNILYCLIMGLLMAVAGYSELNAVFNAGMKISLVLAPALCSEFGLGLCVIAVIAMAIAKRIFRKVEYYIF